MRLSLATRIFIGYAVVLITFGAVSLFSVTELHRNQVEIRLVSEGYLGLFQTASALQNLQKNQADETSRLRVEQNVVNRRLLIQLSRRYFFEGVGQQIDAGLATTLTMMEFAPESEKRFIAELGQKFSDLRTAYDEYHEVAEAAWATLEAPSPDPTSAEERIDKLSRSESALASKIQLIYGAIQSRTLERSRQSLERERRTGLAIIALSVVAIAVGLLATGIAARALRPVRTLIDGVSRIGRGDYSAKLGIQGDDEIAVLAREFDAMARSLKEREAQLAEKQAELLGAERLAAVGRVSAQVAHEVRNPLSSIGLNVEMLSDQIASAHFDDPDGAREARELLDAVTNEVDRITAITDEYLTLARLPSPTLRRENLVAVIDSVIGFSSEELTRSKVEVVRRFPAAAVEALFDENQLRQVILNLLRNAREAMPDGGKVTLTVAVAASGIELQLADTGPGLSAEARARLFEPFFTTKQGGTGLGLSLSRQIIQAHGGRLEASPAGPGTTFVLTLPRP